LVFFENEGRAMANGLEWKFRKARSYSFLARLKGQSQEFREETCRLVLLSLPGLAIALLSYNTYKNTRINLIPQIWRFSSDDGERIKTTEGQKELNL